MQQNSITEMTTNDRQVFAATPGKLERHLQFIDALVRKGGPHESDYELFTSWLNEVGELSESGQLSRGDIAALQARFGEAGSLATLQGHSLLKPHGYAGDYEIIDKMYRRHITPEQHLANWDRYFHALPAGNAVRNRKTYFHELLERCVRRCSGTVKVLNIASGPGRDIYEYLSLHPGADIHFHCVEQDPRAIAYASTLCADYTARVTFTQYNAVRFKPESQYDLVWSAGLFDYFDDRLFVAVLKRLFSGVLPGGELVIGNFSTCNPTRHYMNLMDWVLCHRDAGHLVDLAQQCGIRQDQIRVGEEPEHINLFLHVRF
jgi:extracellular factor (EF) 3-hydroxypalmitic acid methyl ester biosynthesis protein